LKTAKPIADRIRELLSIIEEKIPNLNWIVANFYSDYDNRIYTEIDIKDPLLLAQTHLSFVECTGEAIDTMLEEAKAKKKS